MSIDQTDRIDYIGIDKESGEVVLTISDNLDWLNVCQHTRLLRDKINCYLRFYESGEIYEVYPDAKARRPAILVLGKHSLTPEAQKFYDNAKPVLREAGVELRFKHLA